MTLTIKVKNIDYVEATNITKAVSDVVSDIEMGRLSPSCAVKLENPKMTFDFDCDKPEQVFRGEESTFSRYINGTKKPQDQETPDASVDWGNFL